ncbi:ABC-type multidrug transport system permease subunit [Natranaerovirga hydrolytica]|uniref:ABC-type multidrug transport system permease subunit n=1 Tax=Natranaerovirga hydrolytica TaxID=680378 RepID=A0A4R1M802_9FIRM|nr:ABC transporter permease [Natranaerovirga hydrolytica]TCK87917.1 ABC-type multidrug transport system permease subunit [Natranaerovirga hydrolytica]
MLSILWLRMKRIKEILPMFIGLTVAALGLIAVFGAAFESNYKPTVFVVDHNQTEYSKDFIEQLEANDLFRIDRTTYDDGMEALQDFKGIGVIILEDHFLEDRESSVSVVRTNVNTEYGMLIQFLNNELRNFAHQVNLEKDIQMYFKDNNLEVNALDIRDKTNERIARGWQYPTYITNSYYNKGSSRDDFMLMHSLIGFIVFFSMYTMIFGISDIVEEKKNYVYHRQLVSPISSHKILLGNLLYTFLLSFIQVVLMVVLGKYIFGVNWGNNIGAILMVLMAFVFCGTSLGLLMSSMVKSMQQLTALTPIVLTSTAMLGGCMWPLDIIENRALLFLAQFTPQKWAVEGIGKMAMYNHSIQAIIMPLAVLMSMGILFLIIGTYRMKKI